MCIRYVKKSTVIESCVCPLLEWRCCITIKYKIYTHTNSKIFDLSTYRQKCWKLWINQLLSLDDTYLFMYNIYLYVAWKFWNCRFQCIQHKYCAIIFNFHIYMCYIRRYGVRKEIHRHIAGNIQNDTAIIYNGGGNLFEVLLAIKKEYISIRKQTKRKRNNEHFNGPKLMQPFSQHRSVERRKRTNNFLKRLKLSWTKDPNKIPKYFPTLDFYLLWNRSEFSIPFWGEI